MPSGDGAPTRSKKKSSSRSSATDDILEQKMAAKAKKKKKSSTADDLLDAKMAAKKKSGKSGGGSARANRYEEEKQEEGMSDDEEQQQQRSSKRTSNKKRSPTRNSGVSSGSGTNTESFTRGGGDVRNKPPPSLSNQQQELDPLRQAQLTKEANKKKVNKRYEQLHETGSWGGLNKYEKYGICLLVLGVIGAAIGLGIKFGNPGDGGTVSPTQRPTKFPTSSPSTSPTLAPTDEDYRAETALQMMLDISPKLSLPLEDPTQLIGASTNPLSTPQEIAAEFVIYNDPLDITTRDERFLERYAIIVYYYQNGGCNNDWITSTNWMTFNDPQDNTTDYANHCSNQDNNWYGIVCDLKGRIIEINMSKNYVTGKIPMEFNALKELSTLDLSNNALTGSVPSEALSMKSMYTIQLNNNKLSGTFPFEQVKTEDSILDNLWIQENSELRGTLTEEYCIMNSVTLDCDNFNPQPTYPDDSGDTTFQKNCVVEGLGIGPKEFTCNFDEPVPFEKPDDGLFGNVPAAAPAICGTPAAGQR